MCVYMKKITFYSILTFLSLSLSAETLYVGQVTMSERLEISSKTDIEAKQNEELIRHQLQLKFFKSLASAGLSLKENAVVLKAMRQDFVGDNKRDSHYLMTIEAKDGFIDGRLSAVVVSGNQNALTPYEVEDWDLEVFGTYWVNGHSSSIAHFTDRGHREKLKIVKIDGRAELTLERQPYVLTESVISFPTPRFVAVNRDHMLDRHETLIKALNLHPGSYLSLVPRYKTPFVYEEDAVVPDRMTSVSNMAIRVGFSSRAHYLTPEQSRGLFGLGSPSIIRSCARFLQTSFLGDQRGYYDLKKD